MNHHLQKLKFRNLSWWLIIVFLLVGSYGCTGINLWSSYYKTSGTTNPTPDYANPTIILRGGGVLHRNTVAGALGKEKKGQLYKGEACSWSVLWIIAGGDSSLMAAKNKAGIDFIHYSEYKQEAVFGFFFHSFCTILVGTKAISAELEEAAE
jgi:hypothetical protein